MNISGKQPSRSGCCLRRAPNRTFRIAGMMWVFILLILARLRSSMVLVQERIVRMQALVLYETYLGKWHARVGGVLVAMAGACQSLKQWRQALALYLRAHAVFSRALGRDHLVLAEVQNHIGVCFGDVWCRCDCTSECIYLCFEPCVCTHVSGNVKISMLIFTRREMWKSVGCSHPLGIG